MPDQQDALLKTNANVLTVAMLIAAAMFVALGVFLPQLSGMTGPEGTVMAIALYLAAAGDVAVAFYLRAKIKKAQQAASSGGTIQRQ
jgi:hypothetical protein